MFDDRLFLSGVPVIGWHTNRFTPGKINGDSLDLIIHVIFRWKKVMLCQYCVCVCLCVLVKVWKRNDDVQLKRKAKPDNCY